jgi:hypothetical protein
LATDTYDAVAQGLPREECDDLYARAAELAPVLGAYQQKTDRPIPLFEFTRI